MKLKSLLLFLCLPGLLLPVSGCGGSSSGSSTPAPPSSSDTVPPSDVTVLPPTPGIGSVMLSWQPATDNVAISGYKISIIAPLSAVSRNTDSSAIVDASTLSITWNGLIEGIDYTFTIIAFDTSNNASVNPAAVTAAPLTPDLTPPLDVTNLVGAGGLNSPTPPNFVQLNLSWAPSASPDVSHYLLCIRDITSNTCNVLNNHNVGTVTTLTVPDNTNGPVFSADLLQILQIGTEYVVRVITVDTAGNQSSPGTSIVVIPSASTDNTPPAAVRNLAANPANNSVQLTWDEPLPPGDAGSYSVYYRTNPGSDTEPWIPFSTETTLSRTVTGLTNGVTYEFMVTSIDAAGNEQVGPLTATTSDDDGAKIVATPTSGTILATPSIRGGVFRETFLQTREIRVMVYTSLAGRLAADAQTEFFYTLDGSQIDPSDTSTSATRGYFTFAGADLGTNPNVVEITPDFMYVVTIDFDPAAGLNQNVSDNTLRPDGTADHIELNYQIVRAGVDASPKFTERYLIYQRGNNEFIKFSGVRERRFFGSATLIEPSASPLAGDTPGDVIIAAGRDTNDPVFGAEDTAERYRERFRHFEELRVTGLSGTMNIPRFDHRGTLLDNRRTVLMTGGYNITGDLSPGTGAFPNGNETLGLGSYEVFESNALNEGFRPGPFNLVHSRRFHTATRLFDGRVLLVGGLNGEREILGSLAAPVLNVAHPDWTICFDLSVTTPPPNQTFTGCIVEILDGNPGTAVVDRGIITDEATLFVSSLHCFFVQGLAGFVGTDAPFRIINGAFNQSPRSPGDSVAAEVFDVPASTTTAVADLPAMPRFGHTATLLQDGTVFIAGGAYDYSNPGALNGSGDGFDELACEVFDPDTNTFTDLGDLANLATTRFFHAATLLRDGKVLISGGFSRGDYAIQPTGFPLSGFDEIDVESLRRGNDPRQLPDKVLLLNTAELFDPFTRSTRLLGDRPTQPTLPKSKLNRPRFFHASTLLPSGKVLLCGGFISVAPDGTRLFDASAELYDPDTEQFTVTNSMLTPRGSLSATRIDFPGSEIEGQVLLVGGAQNTLAELYNESKNRFEATAHGMSFDRFVGAATTMLMDGTVLVSGGQGAEVAGVGGLGAGPVQNTGEVYDTSLVEFLPLDQGMENARRHHAATLLEDGTVLITGGEFLMEEVDGNITAVGLATCEIFDPSNGTFTKLDANMIRERSKHAATLLPDGRVFISGGSNRIGSLQSCEFYDPSTQAFVSAPAMSVGRFGHTSTLLPNGWVLITGGENIDDQSVEIFDPISETFVDDAMLVGRDGHSAAQPVYSRGRARFTNASSTVIGSAAGNLFGLDDTLWATPAGIVRPGDLIISETQNVPYVISSVTDDNTLVLADHPVFTHDDGGYSGASTVDNLTQSASPDGFEYYVIVSQDVYIAGGEVTTEFTEVFDFDIGDDEFPLADPAELTNPAVSQLFAAQPLDQANALSRGRDGQDLVSAGDRSLLIVGGRNRDFAEYTTVTGSPADFTADTWTVSNLDPAGTVWEFSNAFRVHNDMIIVIQQHSAQAFLHD